MDNNLYKLFYNGKFDNQIRAFMQKHNVDWIEADHHTIYTFEPVTNMDRDAYVRMWLNNDITTLKFMEFLRTEKWCVQYFLEDFLEMVIND